MNDYGVAMSEPFLAEIRMAAFSFAPRGWALCDGEILPINQNQSLYSLLGTTFGGDGRTSFALPDLRGRTPIHPGDGIASGQHGGEETVTLTAGEMPGHNHSMQGSTDPATSPIPPSNVFASGQTIYGPATNLVNMAPEALGSTGAGQGHENMQPYEVVSFIIALRGLFPSRN